MRLFVWFALYTQYSGLKFVSRVIELSRMCLDFVSILSCCVVVGLEPVTTMLLCRSQLTQRMPMGCIIKTNVFYATAWWRDAGYSGAIFSNKYVRMCALRWWRMLSASPFSCTMILIRLAWISHAFSVVAVLELKCTA